MRVLVCGGRDYDDWFKLHTVLDQIINHKEPYTIITGDAVGADWLARTWCKFNYFQGIEATYEGYPAKWRENGKFNPGAGHIRNQQMIDEGKPDLVVAFPGGTGTADMVKRAKKANIEVIEIE